MNVRIVMKYDTISIYLAQSRSLANSDYTSDESDFEMEEMISAGMKKKRKGQNLDEMVVMAAKEMGKELYADLSLAERKAKLDAMVRSDLRDSYYIVSQIFSIYMYYSILST